MMGHQKILGVSVLEDEAYQRILNWLYDRCGMSYPENKKNLLIQHMQRVRKSFNIPSLATMADKLELNCNHDLQLAVVHAATTNHTYFFREPLVLEYFKNTILPLLPEKDVRIWSAAASSGDEAFTLAIIAAEVRGYAWAKQNLEILGTDISQVVIAAAQTGVYSEAHVDKMPKEFLERYFVTFGKGHFRVQDGLRHVCKFHTFNLKSEDYFFPKLFHVVFCRNVLYYFDRAHQQHVVDAIYKVTEPGGYLVTCVTMSVRDLDSRWIHVENGIYQKAT